MNLIYLKCFFDAVLMGSVTEAARRNFVSQSAVSQAIAKLEKSLGVFLTQHKKQQFKLTEEGKIVFEKAKEIFSAVRRLQDAIDQHRQTPKMPLHFVSTNAIGLSLLPDFIPAFQKMYPDISVHFQFGGLNQIKGWLKQGIAEFALVLQSAHTDEYKQTELYKGHFALYKHKKEKKEVDQIGVYVEHKEGMLVPELLQAYKRLYGESVPIRAELNSWEFISRCLEEHQGYGWIPDLITLKKRYPSLAPLKEILLPYTLCAISLKGEPLSYSAEIFLELFKKNLIS